MLFIVLRSRSIL